MIYKPLGQTGKTISAMGFGVMRFHPEVYKKDHQPCVDVLLRAHELGVNYFDTAPGYCEGHSEQIIGKAMDQIQDKKPYVSTKCGLWVADTAQGVYDEIRRARDVLRMDTIDVYHLWCIKSMAEYQRMIAPGGIYEGVLRAQEEGLLTHIAASLHLESGDIAKVVADGKIEIVTLGYNAINFALRREGLLAAHRAGLGTIIMNPLGGGVIPKFAEKFSFLTRTPDEPVIHAALRFLVGQKEVTAALPGPADMAELEDCVAACAHAEEVTEAYLAEIRGHLRDELDTLCTGCAYCEPCPVDVPIVRLLSAYNQYLVTGEKADLRQFMEGWYSLTAADAEKCTACGLCETRCTQKLPIIERLQEMGSL